MAAKKKATKKKATKKKVTRKKVAKKKTIKETREALLEAIAHPKSCGKSRRPLLRHQNRMSYLSIGGMERIPVKWSMVFPMVKDSQPLMTLGQIQVICMSGDSRMETGMVMEPSPSLMDLLIQGNTETMTQMVRALAPFPMGQSMSGNGNTTKQMVRAPKFIPMDQSMLENLRKIMHGKELNTTRVGM